ncbi:hypothetical protein NDR87_36790 [Nocardia sp. CDC159]|uniref:DUF8020 domain-containing protein n=1 Tax=Nocardia pulmonis TaxID=2951408 RepID=A0A9X2EEV1_9NOCA|nr:MULTISPECIES: hypothetical protein [Nocardia]MCM6779045.1 hypothetical protein [Nocardia pulmonis]MCM6791935.1 hypothetical protein [Nocardia sp. CDC159]
MKAIRAAVLPAFLTALVGTSGVVHAQPPAEMTYTAKVSGDSVILDIDSGTLSVANGQLQIRDPGGALVGGIPLGYERAGMRWPVAASVDGRTARLTPSTDPAAAVPAPIPALTQVDLNPESDQFNDALSHFSTQVGVGAALGGLIGTVVGAGIGCVLGGVVAGTTAAIPTIGLLAVPGFLGGCLITAAAAAAIGGVVGTIAIGVPVAIAAGILLFDTVEQPPAPATE